MILHSMMETICLQHGVKCEGGESVTIICREYLIVSLCCHSLKASTVYAFLRSECHV